jgi:hypothetical protein
MPIDPLWERLQSRRGKFSSACQARSGIAATMAGRRHTLSCTTRIEPYVGIV